MDLVSSDNFIPLENLLRVPTYRAGVAQSTANRLLKKFTEDCISHYGITMTQWYMLGVIYDAGDTGLTMTELSQQLDTNLPYITNTLNLLTHKHMVVREAKQNDSRTKIVRVADSFKPMIPEIEAELRTAMRDTIYGNITADELRTYITVLYKLAAALDSN